MTDFEKICEALRRYIDDLPTEGGRGNRDSWLDRLDDTLMSIRVELAAYEAGRAALAQEGGGDGK